MIFHTYGDKENKAVVLIHGMLTPWQIWNTAVDKFKRNCYVIVPELDAHTEVTPTVFHSIEEEADKIHDYIMKELNGAELACFKPQQWTDEVERFIS